MENKDFDYLKLSEKLSKELFKSELTNKIRLIYAENHNKNVSFLDFMNF